VHAQVHGGRNFPVRLVPVCSQCAHASAKVDCTLSILKLWRAKSSEPRHFVIKKKKEKERESQKG